MHLGLVRGRRAARGLAGGRTAAVALLGLLLSTPARAESEDVVLEYQAFAGCPDRARFEAEVRALSTRAHFVEALPGARRFRVRLRRDAKGVQGTLNISTDAGDSERRVSGKTCNEVASALALATAIAVDPTVLGETSEPKPKPPPAPKPAPLPPARPSPELDRPPVRQVSEPSRALIGIGVGLERAIAPALGSRFSLRVGWQPAGRWAPLLFVEGGYVLPVTTDFAKFSDLYALRSGVSLRLFESAPWSAGPELAFEVGNVKASGNPDVVSNPRDEQILSTAGVVAAFVRFGITPAFLLELTGGAVLPFVRRDYSYRPRSPVAEPVVAHSTPPVGFSAGMRLALFL